MRIHAGELEDKNAAQQLNELNLDGLIIPGGFGNRGMEGKIKAVQRARENGIPFLGLCLGLQMAIIEFARHVCNLPKAHSVEYGKTPDPVISRMPGQSEELKKGGSMRLGGYTTKLVL